MSRLSGFYYSRPEIALWKRLATNENINVSRVIDMAIRYYMKFGEYLNIASLHQKDIALFNQKEKMMIRYKDDIYEYLVKQKEIYLTDMSSQVERILLQGIKIVEDEKDSKLVDLDELLQQYRVKVDSTLQKQETYKEAGVAITDPDLEIKEEESAAQEAPSIKQAVTIEPRVEVEKKPVKNDLGNSIIDGLIDFNVDLS